MAGNSRFWLALAPGRAFSGLQSRAGPCAFFDDRGVALYELSGQLSGRVARLLLEQHGEAQLLPHDRGRGRRRGRVDHSSQQASPQIVTALTFSGGVSQLPTTFAASFHR